MFLDVKDAAENIGEKPVSNRTWQYWEAGRSQVPEDIAEAMQFWNQWRDGMLGVRLEQCRPNDVCGGSEKIKLNYYKTLDCFEKVTGKRNVITWRISQSIAAQLYSQGLVELVESGGLSANAQD
jgi:hypothetical protein